MDLNQFLADVKIRPSDKNIILAMIIFDGFCNAESLRIFLGMNKGTFRNCVNRVTLKGLLKKHDRYNKRTLFFPDEIRCKKILVSVGNDFCHDDDDFSHGDDEVASDDATQMCVINEVASDDATQSEKILKSIIDAPASQNLTSVTSENLEDEKLKKTTIKVLYKYKKEEKKKETKSLNNFASPPAASQSISNCPNIDHLSKNQTFKNYIDEIFNVSSGKHIRDDLSKAAQVIVYDSGDLTSIKDYTIGKVKSQFNSSPVQQKFGEDIIGFFNANWKFALEEYDLGIRKFVDEVATPMTADENCRLFHQDYFPDFKFFSRLDYDYFNILMGRLQKRTNTELLTYREIIEIGVAYSIFKELNKNLDETIEKINNSKRNELNFSDSDWRDVFDDIFRMEEIFNMT